MYGGPISFRDVPAQSTPDRPCAWGEAAIKPSRRDRFQWKDVQNWRAQCRQITSCGLPFVERQRDAILRDGARAYASAEPLMPCARLHRPRYTTVYDTLCAFRFTEKQLLAAHGNTDVRWPAALPFLRFPAMRRIARSRRSGSARSRHPPMQSQRPHSGSIHIQ